MAIPDVPAQTTQEAASGPTGPEPAPPPVSSVNAARRARINAAEPQQDTWRIEPGAYQAVYEGHRPFKIFNGKALKLQVDFRLIEHAQIVLPRFFPIRNHASGRISAGRHSDLVRELSAVLGRRVRADRIPISDLSGLLLDVLVRDVVTDHRQRPLAPVNRYSIIAQLVGRV
jgi:hypothetical protein